MDVSITTSSFLVYSFQVTQQTDNINTNGFFSFHPVGVFHALYNVQLSDGYENVFKEMCWNDAQLINGMEDQCMRNCHNNNTTHIYSVAMNVGMVDMLTLQPWSCHIIFHIYDSHAASLSFYMSQICDYSFHQTFIFLHFELYL